MMTMMMMMMMMMTKTRKVISALRPVLCGDNLLTMNRRPLRSL